MLQYWQVTAQVRLCPGISSKHAGACSDNNGVIIGTMMMELTRSVISWTGSTDSHGWSGKYDERRTKYDPDISMGSHYHLELQFFAYLWQFSIIVR